MDEEEEDTVQSLREQVAEGYEKIAKPVARKTVSFGRQLLEKGEQLAKEVLEGKKLTQAELDIMEQRLTLAEKQLDLEERLNQIRARRAKMEGYDY